jgi:hypothetical protein
VNLYALAAIETDITIHLNPLSKIVRMAAAANPKQPARMHATSARRRR